MTQYRYVSLTDFGEPGRRHIIQRHLTRGTAERQFKRLLKIYGPNGTAGKGRGDRCWLETWEEVFDPPHGPDPRSNPSTVILNIDPIADSFRKGLQA